MPHLLPSSWDSCLSRQSKASRALGKAHGMCIYSVEEIGSFVEPARSSRESKKLPPQPGIGAAFTGCS